MFELSPARERCKAFCPSPPRGQIHVFLTSSQGRCAVFVSPYHGGMFPFLPRSPYRTSISESCWWWRKVKEWTGGR